MRSRKRPNPESEGVSQSEVRAVRGTLFKQEQSLDPGPHTSPFLPHTGDSTVFKTSAQLGSNYRHDLSDQHCVSTPATRLCQVIAARFENPCTQSVVRKPTTRSAAACRKRFSNSCCRSKCTVGNKGIFLPDSQVVASLATISLLTATTSCAKTVLHSKPFVFTNTDVNYNAKEATGSKRKSKGGPEVKRHRQSQYLGKVNGVGRAKVKGVSNSRANVKGVSRSRARVKSDPRSWARVNRESHSRTRLSAQEKDTSSSQGQYPCGSKDSTCRVVGSSSSVSYSSDCSLCNRSSGQISCGSHSSIMKGTEELMESIPASKEASFLKEPSTMSFNNSNLEGAFKRRSPRLERPRKKRGPPTLGSSRRYRFGSLRGRTSLRGSRRARNSSRSGSRRSRRQTCSNRGRKPARKCSRPSGRRSGQRAVVGSTLTRVSKSKAIADMAKARGGLLSRIGSMFRSYSSTSAAPAAPSRRASSASCSSCSSSSSSTSWVSRLLPLPRDGPSSRSGQHRAKRSRSDASRRKQRSDTRHRTEKAEAGLGCAVM